ILNQPGLEAAIRLQEKLNEEERQRISRDTEITRRLHEETNVAQETSAQAKQSEEREQVIDWSDPSVLRLKRKGQEVQKEPAETQKTETKAVEEEKVKEEDVKPEQIVKEVSKKSGGRRRKSLARKRARETLDEETSKKQKLDDEEATDYEKEKEELRMCLGSEHVCKIIRADGNTSYHKSFESMQKRFDRQYLVDLHRLVMKRLEDNTPEGYNLMLWGDLKTMFELNAEHEVWSNQQEWKMLSWKLYENCGVHTLLLDGTLITFHMLVEKRYPFTKEMLEKMLNWRLEAEAESTMAFELLKFVKSQIEEQ
ncbi:hypothetical protein Tco_0766191, partial [Tanacetum coccineum]